MPIVNFDGHSVYSTGEYDAELINTVFNELVHAGPGDLHVANRLVEPYDTSVSYTAEWYEEDHTQGTVLLFICVDSLFSKTGLTNGYTGEFNFAISEHAYNAGIGGSLDQFMRGLMRVDTRIKSGMLKKPLPAIDADGLRRRVIRPVY